MATEEAVNKIAQQLSLDWNKLMEGVDERVVVPMGPNLPVFIRQLANKIVTSELTHRTSFSTVRALLPLLIRQLKKEIATKEWKAAIANVLATRKSIKAVNPGLTMFAGQGVAVGPASHVFFELLQEALVQGAATRHHSFVLKDDQPKLRGMAVDWGLRYMLAFALDYGYPETETGPDDKEYRTSPPSIDEQLRLVLAPLEE